MARSKCALSVEDLLAAGVGMQGLKGVLLTAVQGSAQISVVRLVCPGSWGAGL